MPQSIPVALISSSMSGQCTPNPFPMISKLLRSSSVAPDNRQDHTNSTLMERPSASWAMIESSFNWISTMRGAALSIMSTSQVRCFQAELDRFPDTLHEDIQ